MKRFVALSAVLFALVLPALSQDWIRTGTGVGGEKIRLAVPDFKIASADPQSAPLDQTFNSVLFNDLYQAGIFDMVSKSFYPLGAIGAPADVQLDALGRTSAQCCDAGFWQPRRQRRNAAGAGLAL